MRGKRGEKVLKPEKLKKLLENTQLTDREVQTLLTSTPQRQVKRTYNHSNGKRDLFGVISDSHIGHIMFDESLLEHVAKTFKSIGIERVYHVGDILEGMSGRDGHVYELAQVGFSQQITYAEQLFNEYLSPFEVYGIIGNHDEWYMKKNNGGVNVGEELEKRVSHFTFLGNNEADIKLSNNVKMKLFHPGDGTAYATSYKLQKLIESFEGGSKPNILFEGHYHKALYMFNRNVHAFESGTLCGQTGWMRGKKIPAHKGAWIVDLKTGKRGIEQITPQFIPAYD